MLREATACIPKTVPVPGRLEGEVICDGDAAAGARPCVLRDVVIVVVRRAVVGEDIPCELAVVVGGHLVRAMQRQKGSVMLHCRGLMGRCVVCRFAS